MTMDVFVWIAGTIIIANAVSAAGKTGTASKSHRKTRAPSRPASNA